MPTDNAQKPSRPRIVVLGGGFAGLEALFNLRKRLGRTADLTLVSESDVFRFKPNTIYVPFGKDPEQFQFPIGAALDRKHIRFLKARVEDVNPNARVVRTSSGDLPYDELIIATGAVMRPEEVPGMTEHANTIWTPEEMLRLRTSFQEVAAKARAGTAQKVLFLVPPNNKCSGPLYEMVLMLDTWLRRQAARAQVAVTYATAEHHFIQAFGPRLHDVITREFKERGITGILEKRIASIEKGLARFADGSTLPFDVLVTFPPYAAAVRYSALPTDDRGFLHTELQTRRVAGHDDIYAVGDAGDFPVKQAFLGLLQADAVAERIAQKLLHEPQDAIFDPVSMCIMEQFDKATFAQVPLQVTANPDVPVVVRSDTPELYKVGSGEVWRVGKKMLGMAIPGRFRMGQPFHAGAAWAVMESGVKAMSAVFAD